VCELPIEIEQSDHHFSTGANLEKVNTEEEAALSAGETLHPATAHIVHAMYYPSAPLPSFFHYCQFFRVGELGFQKRRLRKSMFECNQPLLAEPPTDLAKLDYKNRDGEVQ
jgi:hypothetical protein